MICSADLSAGDHLRHSFSDNLINFAPKIDEIQARAASCIRQQEVCNDLNSSTQKSIQFISPKSKTNSQATSVRNSLKTEMFSTKNFTHVSGCSACATRNVSEQHSVEHSSLESGKSSKFAVIHKGSNPTEKLSLNNSVHSIYCSSCVEGSDITKRLLSELEDRLQVLVSDLIKEKSNNHILKRNYLVAKKVIRNEVMQLSTDEMDNLMWKSSENSWKGQQEIILALKRKVGTLCTAVSRLKIESHQQDRKISLLQMQSRKLLFSKRDPDKGNEHRYLESGREEILRHQEKYKKGFITSRDSMEYALERQCKRNEALMNEIYVLREQLSSTESIATGDFHELLRQIEKNMRKCLEEKAEERRKLDSLQEQIRHKSRAVLDLKEKIDTERKIATSKKAALVSLKKNGTSICMLSLELREVKCKQAFITKKLDEMLKEYGKIVARGETIFTPTVDGRILLRKLNLMQKQNTTNKDDGKKYRTLKTMTEENTIMPTIPSKKMTARKSIIISKIKLAKYQEKFKHFENQNLAKLKGLQDTVCKTKEDLSIILRNRDNLLKLETDINVLKNRKKKLSKVASQLPKRKLVRKKNSCPQLTEILDAGRMHFNILKLESKFLRTLIKQIFASKGDDQGLIESFFRRNKDVLSKCS